jgi:hypothetical protein
MLDKLVSKKGIEMQNFKRILPAGQFRAIACRMPATYGEAVMLSSLLPNEREVLFVEKPDGSLERLNEYNFRTQTTPKEGQQPAEFQLYVVTREGLRAMDNLEKR